MASSLPRQVRERAKGRCEYCRLPQLASNIPFEIDHIIARKHGGHDAAGNRALACWYRNSFKGSDLTGIDPSMRRITRLFHPRRHKWAWHFRYEGPRLVRRTAIGRTTVRVLQINCEEVLTLRESLMAEGVVLRDRPNLPVDIQPHIPGDIHGCRHRKRLESTLPDMTRAVIMGKIPANMSGHQPLHPAAPLAILPRPEREMEMIRHQAIRHHTHRYTEARFTHQPNERLIVACLLENPRASITPVQNMVAVASRCGPRRPRPHSRSWQEPGDKDTEGKILPNLCKGRQEQ
jgi:hypothetical protein